METRLIVAFLIQNRSIGGGVRLRRFCCLGCGDYEWGIDEGQKRGLSRRLGNHLNNLTPKFFFFIAHGAFNLAGVKHCCHAALWRIYFRLGSTRMRLKDDLLFLGFFMLFVLLKARIQTITFQK
ncbi:uncharacterized protein BYT42DRAFT_43978 [Radiomyces spectabilis]|uniref:uncharacterized protein n=1 Tax=Radiomyces spectabilis TaxID=64574 RepID=UPI00221E8C36|nr:uncharacterized protein BYT42DRAFT_43978 [Radiomyces spectabilis]KAI8372735.1 hypothetical protein BYT42DRAFT_43978 [Radiomyces spectabilis]